MSTPRPPFPLQSDQSQALNELKDMMAQVLKSMNNITERIANMEKSMEGKANNDVVKGLDERLKKQESKQDQVEQLELTGKDQVQAKIIEMINVKAKEQQEEAEDRARRSKNLLILGLDEPKKEDRDERKAEETGTVQNTMKEIKCEDCKYTPCEIRRLGNFSDKGPRPLRISFGDQLTRDEVMHAFWKAKKETRENEEVKQSKPIVSKINGRKDLTPSERKDEEKLYKELKEKQEVSKQSGDDNAKWVRRKGKVVNVGKYPGPQLVEGIEEK